MSFRNETDKMEGAAVLTSQFSANKTHCSSKAELELHYSLRIIAADSL